MDMIDERFWVALSFFIFIALIYKPVAKIVISKLDERSHTIQKALESAHRAVIEAGELLELNKKYRTEINEDIDVIISRANNQSVLITQESKDNLQAMSAIKEEAMDRKIAEQQHSMENKLLIKSIDDAFVKSEEILASNVGKNLSDSVLKQLDNELKQFITN